MVVKITAGSQLLTGVPPAVANFADNELKKLHVKVVKDTKIVSTSITPINQTELTLANGEKMVVDLYLPTIGVVPNSEFLPKNLLDDKGYLMVDQYLKVKGAEDIWAAGDITDVQPAQYIYCGLSYHSINSFGFDTNLLALNREASRSCSQESRFGVQWQRTTGLQD